jgi:hypothetical protein
VKLRQLSEKVLFVSCKRHISSKNGKDKIYRTIALPVILHECETWSLTLRKECRLRFFENRVLRRIFGPKKDEVTREWRRLHNKELYALYSSPNIIRVIKSRRLRWAGHVARIWERCIQGFSGKISRKETTWKTQP